MSERTEKVLWLIVVPIAIVAATLVPAYTRKLDFDRYFEEAMVNRCSCSDVSEPLKEEEQF
jgi:hypothetical protein